jgi:16S rRNA (uracil1498-N3)-methyltransferase
MAVRRRIHHPAPLEEDTEVRLSPEASGHLVRVLRLTPGTPLILFDGTGTEADAVLVKADPKRAIARVGRIWPGTAEAPLELVLIQGYSRGAKMDIVIQKATELGVSMIAPAQCARSVARVDASRAARRAGHWRQVAVSACEQSGRSRVPEIQEPTTLEKALRVRPDLPGFVLDPAAARTFVDVPRPTAGLRLLVGPEGGLSEDEVRLAAEAGFQRVRLGPRILRTETAAIAALAVAGFLWGDLAHPSPASAPQT